MSANDRQVGGTHYQQNDNPQHWDLVAMYGWDYFQGQITKYLMRWKTKHPTREGKLQDLRKALHFLQKYVEIEEARKLHTLLEEVQECVEAREGIAPSVEELLTDTLSLHENQSPRYISSPDFLCEGGWGDGRNLYTCQKCREQFKAEGIGHAALLHRCDDGGPTPAYVNQG